MRIVERKPELKHIEGRLTLKILTDIILLDEKLTERDTVILNSRDFDNIVLEYREVIGVDMGFPMFYGVLIKEKEYEIIPQNKIGILRNDEISYRSIVNDEFNSFNEKTVYRCGRCGSFVEEDGLKLEGYKLEKAIRYIKNAKTPIVCHTHRDCCF